MRITFDDLVTITSKKTPEMQAGWFKTHFNVDAVYDSTMSDMSLDKYKSYLRHGLII